MSTQSDAAFAVWCAVVFVVLAVLVVAVRRSWFGRQLTALRDSEVAAATAGLRVRQTKLIAFAFSGFIVGCAGALFGGLNGIVGGTQFEVVNGLVIVLFAFVGGITTVTGAGLGGALFALLVYVQTTVDGLSGVVFVAVAALAVTLAREPNGLAGIVLGAKPQSWRVPLIPRLAERRQARAQVGAEA